MSIHIVDNFARQLSRRLTLCRPQMSYSAPTGIMQTHEQAAA
jgi:hypothetical protein